MDVLKTMPDNSIDLIITSPPYADQRKNTYGGINVNDYVNWFLPISKELLRVLKPSGTFILNIKEKVVDRPKALGDIRGVTYIYGMFYRFGLIDVPDEVKEKMGRPKDRKK